MINNIRKKKTLEEFHIFVILFAFTGILTDLTYRGWVCEWVFEDADYESELKINK